MANYQDKTNKPNTPESLGDSHRLIWRAATNFDNPITAIFWCLIALSVYVLWLNFWGGLNGRDCSTGWFTDIPKSEARMAGCTVKSIADTLFPESATPPGDYPRPASADPNPNF